ncbi:MAG: DUF4830 domain-containing protein [Oscillospiraceae bacterium]|nr:DUF4830 domain-containing protein [Oscillospiraceae bacterium]
MFIYSLKASTLKFVAVVIISIGLLITLITVIPSGGESVYAASGQDNKSSVKINYKNIKVNEERIEFLRQFGWEVSPEPVEAVEILIPKEFDSVYKKYNDVQKAQSLNLEKYRNKAVKRYTYEITDYPNHTGTVYANILVYKDRVIGGDICSAEINGFMHGFDKNNKPLF